MKILFYTGVLLFIVMLMTHPTGVFAAAATDVICTGCVGTTDIANSAVTRAKLGNDAVTSAKILDGSITDIDISATAAISASKLSDGIGSGLDADLFDGLNSSQFLRADKSGALSGSLAIIAADSSNLLLSTTTGYGPALTIGGSTSFELLSTAGSDTEGVNRFVIKNVGSGADLFTITDSGYLGLNTSDPTKPLTIDAGDDSALYLLSNISDDWYVGPNVANGFGIYDVTQSASRFHITTGGNVGIGTTAPGVKFSVVAGADTWAGSFFGLDTGDQVRLGTYGGVAAIGANNSLGSAWANLALNPGGGYVGIGTTAPSVPLQVSGSGGSTIVVSTTSTLGPGIILGGGTSFGLRSTNSGDAEGSNKFIIDNAGSASDLLTIDYTGNVGIGTTTPAEKLDVVGNIKASGTVCDGTGACIGGTSSSGVSGSGTGAYLSQWTGSGSSTSLGDSVIYDSGTNVGIDTTSTASKLTIGAVGGSKSSEGGEVRLNGAGSNDYFYIDNYDGDARFVMSDAGVESTRLTLGNGGKLTINGEGDHWAIDAISNTTDDDEGGVYGEASLTTTGNTIGVYGLSRAPGSASGSALGVRGDATNTTPEGGATFGVLGYTYRTLPNTAGVSASAGVYGGALGGSDGMAHGVQGETNSEQIGAAGVWGGTGKVSSGKIFGVYGETESTTDGSAAVKGVAQALSGVTKGVWGQTNSTQTDAAGVWGGSGASGSVFGVYGETESTTNGSAAIMGVAQALSGATKGVWGQTNSSGSSAYGVYSSGTLGASGTKPAIVYTDMQGPTQLYAEEATDVWFEDIGEGKLVNGKITINLDPLFLQTVTINEQYPMQVFVQPYANVNLYVERGQNSFTVFAQNNGTSNAPFAYRIMAKRKYYEDYHLRPTQVTIDQFMRPDLTLDGLRALNIRWDLPFDK